MLESNGKHILEEQFDTITQCLDASSDWEIDNPDEHTWMWFPESDEGDNKAKQGIAIETFQDGQRPISGSLELKPTVLILTTNSMDRAECAKDDLETILHICR